MPNYKVFIDGKIRKIELTRISPNSFAAKIDGKPREVKLQKDEITSGKAFAAEINGKTYWIELSKVERGEKIPVEVEDARFEVGVEIAYERQALMGFDTTLQEAMKTATPIKVAVEGAVTAPMTGRIVRVNVKKGDQVKVNQVLCVIEAMKMENEISAPRAGAVREINVAEGTPVSEGETLFVID